MQTMMANAARYDWVTWRIGIMRAFIAAGAGSVAAPTGPMIMDSKDYNLGPHGIVKVLATMAIAFLFSGITGMCIFLKTHGAPDRLQESLATAAAENVKAGDAIASAQQDAQKPRQ